MLSRVLSFVYPNLCFHCQERTSHWRHLLCPSCATLLTPLDPKLCCYRCSAPDPGLCSSCRTEPLATQHLAVFECAGPARSLLRAYERGDHFLASSLGAFMAAQYLSHGGPLPDILIPLRFPWFQRLLKGNNPHQLLAQEVGKLLDRPLLSSKVSLCDKRVLLIATTLDRTALNLAVTTCQLQFPEHISALSLVVTPS